MIFVTGGAGFIGANFIMNWLLQNDEHIVNIDAKPFIPSE
jgi:dTDP-glucose 4,6-dehydratase